MHAVVPPRASIFNPPSLDIPRRDSSAGQTTTNQSRANPLHCSDARLRTVQQCTRERKRRANRSFQQTTKPRDGLIDVYSRLSGVIPLRRNRGTTVFNPPDSGPPAKNTGYHVHDKTYVHLHLHHHCLPNRFSGHACTRAENGRLSWDWARANEATGYAMRSLLQDRGEVFPDNRRRQKKKNPQSTEKDQPMKTSRLSTTVRRRDAFPLICHNKTPTKCNPE